MRKINYKSDFDAVLRLRDCEDPDKFVPWPDCDFEVVFWTSGKARCHTASRNGGTYTNCFATGDGGMHFVFKGHRMGMGTLKWEPHFALPNGIYPDGIQDVYRRADLGITLVDGEGDCPTTADVEVLVPYIKFKYEDLTDAEKAELGKPATDAAASVAELERSVETAEAGRVEGEKSRVAAETTRQTDEATRQSNEAEREEAEAERGENEDRRVSAESKRAEEFAAWQGEIDSKADKSELSNIIAEEPLTPDNFPDINTYTREELKKNLFIDMWNAALSLFKKMPTYAEDVANTKDDGSQFGLNKLVMDYQTALKVYEYSDFVSRFPAFQFSQHVDNRMPADIKTLFPTFATTAVGSDNCRSMYSGCYNLEAVCLFSEKGAIIYPGTAQYMFNNCTALTNIYGVLDLGTITNASNLNQIFANDYYLSQVHIANIKADLSLASCSKISIDSISYLVQNAANTTPITITVHPDVYAKLTDEANAEWHQVLIDAAAKNINFATT